MATDVVEVKSYEYYAFSSRDAISMPNAVIMLYGANGAYLGGAWFVKDNTVKLAPATKSPQGYYTLFYSYVDLPILIDMLRNERPVYLLYDDAFPAWNARLSTLQEPVGEGEGPL